MSTGADLLVHEVASRAARADEAEAYIQRIAADLVTPDAARSRSRAVLGAKFERAHPPCQWKL